MRKKIGTEICLNISYSFIEQWPGNLWMGLCNCMCACTCVYSYDSNSIKECIPEG